jgi:hypothetical protein
MEASTKIETLSGCGWLCVSPALTSKLNEDSDTSPGSPDVEWSSLQTKFIKGTAADVLMFLDCCAAAGSARTAGQGMVEVIAASGFENTTPMRGQHTFTTHLKKELQDCLIRDLPNNEIPAIYLHTRLINRLKRFIPVDGTERRITPIHYYLAHGKTVRSIRLRKWESVEDEVSEQSTTGASSTEPSSLSPTKQLEYDVMLSNPDTTIFHEIWPDRVFQHEKVLLAINLSKSISQDLDMASFQQWLREVPAFVDFVNIEAVYRSNSTLLLASVSIAIWDMLPDHPATNFVGFISSENLKDKLVPEAEVHEVPWATNAAGSSFSAWQELVGRLPPQKAPEMSSNSSDSYRSAVFSVDDDGSVISAATQHTIERPTPVGHKEESKPATSPPYVESRPVVPERVSWNKDGQNADWGAALQSPTFPSSGDKRSQPPITSRLQTIAAKLMPKKNTYVYREMYYESQIRLLKVFKGKITDQLETMLFERATPDSPHKARSSVSTSNTRGDEYVALSYCWGEDEPCHRLIIYGDAQGRRVGNALPPDVRSSLAGVVYIRDNLNAALQALRHEEYDVNVWVDAICIDPGNYEEKAAQVQAMPDIFHGAKSVLVWIGSGSSRSEETFYFLQSILDVQFLDNLIKTRAQAKMWNLVLDLLKNKLFSRRWVIQEIALAKNAHLVQGQQSMPWFDFVDAISLIMMNSDAIQSIFGKSSLSLDRFSANALINMSQNLFRWGQDRTIQQALSPLETLVTSWFVPFETLDPSDAIFSVLSLAKETSTIPCQFQQQTPLDQRLSPDYSKNYTDVFADFMDYCIETSQSLDILCRHWAPQPRKPNLKSRLELLQTEEKRMEEKIPTWIPSVSGHAFGSSRETLTGRKNGDSFVGDLDVRYRQVYNASRGLRPMFKFGKNMVRSNWFKGRQPPPPNKFDGTLYLKGLRLGVVSQVSPRVIGVVPREVFDIGGMLSESSDELWRVFVADRDPNGFAPPTWYRRVFRDCLLPAADEGDLNLMDFVTSNTSNVPGAVAILSQRILSVVWNRRVFLAEGTRSGKEKMVGLCPPATKERDIITILFGCSVPVVLRMVSFEGKHFYTLVGECYVHGMMDGEAIPDGKAPQYPYSDFEGFVLI